MKFDLPESTHHLPKFTRYTRVHFLICFVSLVIVGLSDIINGKEIIQKGISGNLLDAIHLIERRDYVQLFDARDQIKYQKWIQKRKRNIKFQRGELAKLKNLKRFLRNTIK